ncbi:MAG: glycine--tRNA ligase subunit beta, partial [Streptosporangiaceae bacterium]
MVELGCEELPARQVEALASQLGEALVAELRRAQLLGAESGRLTIASTPRRLICLQPEVLERQPETEEEVIGPPARLAFADGGLTPQGLGFAAKNQAGPAEVYRVATPKGEYAALKRKQGGAEALSLLSELIPRAFHALALPRSMVWEGRGERGLRFVRPLRWLLAFHGETLVPFRLGSLESAPQSFGHRTLSGGAFAVRSADEY